MTDQPAPRLTNTRVGTGTRGDFVLPRGDLILQQVLEFGGHTRPEVALLASIVRSGDTILDIGAHVGTFCIPLARRAGPTGQVCAFEPTPSTYELLLLNIELNGLASVIRPIDLAVSDRVGAFEVETPNVRNMGGSYLRPSDEGIVSVALDDWVEVNLPERCVDVIKIDVEGMELLVLEGGRGVIERFSPSVYLEVDLETYSRYGADVDAISDALEGYRFFVNEGDRNAATDKFQLKEINRIHDVESSHFDILAMSPDRIGRMESW